MLHIPNFIAKNFGVFKLEEFGKLAKFGVSGEFLIKQSRKFSFNNKI